MRKRNQAPPEGAELLDLGLECCDFVSVGRAADTEPVDLGLEFGGVLTVGPGHDGSTGSTSDSRMVSRRYSSGW